MEIKPYSEYGRNVAIIGASTKRHRFSNKAVRAFSQEGYEVFPVNPNEKEIEGFKTYETVDEIPGGVNIVSIYINPSHQNDNLVNQIEKSKSSLVIFNPGTDNSDIENKIASSGIEVREECSIIGLGRNPAKI